MFPTYRPCFRMGRRKSDYIQKCRASSIVYRPRLRWATEELFVFEILPINQKNTFGPLWIMCSRAMKRNSQPKMKKNDFMLIWLVCSGSYGKQKSKCVWLQLRAVCIYRGRVGWDSVIVHYHQNHFTHRVAWIRRIDWNKSGLSPMHKNTQPVLLCSRSTLLLNLLYTFWTDDRS